MDRIPKRVYVGECAGSHSVGRLRMRLSVSPSVPQSLSFSLLFYYPSDNGMMRASPAEVRFDVSLWAREVKRIGSPCDPCVS